MQNPISVYGIPISRMTMEECLIFLQKALEKNCGAPTLVFTPNLEMLSQAKRSEKIRSLLRKADLLLPDGIGVQLLSCLRINTRLAGIDVGEALLALSEREGYRVYLLGGSKGVALRAAESLIKRFPNLKIVGVHHGYFDEREEKYVLKEICTASPDLLFVCMGFPRQEIFLARNRAALSSVRLALGLGGALDVFANDLRRAPPWMRRCGLEWLYRVCREPKRAHRILSSIKNLLLPKK